MKKPYPDPPRRRSRVFSRRDFIRTAAWGLPSLSALGALLSSCGRMAHGTPPPVILIVLDTVRADHLSCYGYERATTPCIDALAEKASFYTRALATSPWTVPTHASLFTGRHSFQHGAHTVPVSEPVNNVAVLDKEFLTIAEALWIAGYKTGAFVANRAYLGPRWQMNQGFEQYLVHRGHAPGLNEYACSWVAEHAQVPFFLFINYMDAHRPYNTTRPAPFLDTPAPVDSVPDLDALCEAVLPGALPPPDLQRRVIDAYDTAIYLLDQELGHLFTQLRQLGVYDNALLIVTSDHGEYFGEHALVEHSKDVYDEALRVPLIVKSPGQRDAGVVTDVTTSVDIPDMILSALPETASGEFRPYFPYRSGNHEIIAENYYTRTKDLFHETWGHRFNRVRTALYDGPYKYIRSSDGRNELYDIEQDPKESSNLLEVRPAVAESLHARLQAFVGAGGKTTGAAVLTEKETQVLRSLGYAGDE